MQADRLQGVPHVVYRQSESGAVLLGRFRSERLAFLRTHRATASRWFSELAGLGDAPCVFHEEQAVGFWPGMAGLDAAFYSYSYPEPPGLAESKIELPGAWNSTLHEFILPYEDVRTALDPDKTVLDFFNSTYAPVADLLKWDRAALEAH